MTLPPRRFGFLVSFSALSALLLPAAAGYASTPGSGATPTPTAATTAAAGAAGEGRAFSSRAVPAASFVDSIGVNTHLHYDDTSYGRFEDLVKPRLLELGVHHVRDGVYTYADASADDAYYRKLRDLAGHGIRFNLTTGMATNWGGERTDFSKLDDVQQWTGNAVDTFEGVNEPDLQDIAGWADKAREVQRDLAQTVRSTPSLSGVKVLGPSVTSEEASKALGNLSPWLDAGNLHNYPTDRIPESAGWGSNGYGSLEWSMGFMAGRVAPKMPVVTTETGFYTSPTNNNGISETAAAGYTPRLLLNQFRGGVSRTYLYEMMRQRTDAGDPEANFGLVRADGSRTPTFNAVSSMIDLLEAPARGTASAASAPTLGWKVDGNTSGLQQMPIRLASGEYVLALWTNGALWDEDKDRPVADAQRRIELTPASGLEVAGVVKQADSGEFVERAAHGRTTELSVGARLSFVRIAGVQGPGGTTTPASPGTSAGKSGGKSVKVHTQGSDKGGDVRGSKAGTPLARTADLRRATVGSKAGRVRLQVSTAGGAKLTRRDTLTYTVKSSGRPQPLLRWSSKGGPRLAARPGTGSCGKVTAAHKGGKLQVSVPAGCLPQRKRMTLTISTTLRHTTSGGSQQWADSMRGPSITVS